MRRVHRPTSADEAAPPAGLPMRILADEAIRRDAAQRHDQGAAAIAKEAGLRRDSKSPQVLRNRDLHVAKGNGPGLHQHAGSFDGAGERRVRGDSDSVMADP